MSFITRFVLNWSVLQDVSLVSPKDTANVIDRSKIRRERKKVRWELQSKARESVLELQGLYFNGRKDKTTALDGEGKKFHRIMHVLLAESDSTLGHTTPASGTSINITQSIINFLSGCATGRLNISKLLAIGCDGTNVNTGYKNGFYLTK